MVDYKKVAIGEVIELTDEKAAHFIKAGSVEKVDEAKKAEVDPLIVQVGGEDVDLAKLDGKGLQEVITALALNIEREKKESNASFSQRIYTLINAGE